MKFWKEHAPLRIALLLVLFGAGIGAIIVGESMTGKMTGLLIMLLGLALLLAALALYNKPFEDPKPKKKTN
ncbi:MAG: hypothetical protein RR216_02105 [Pseudoflavonifractor sp.]